MYTCWYLGLYSLHYKYCNEFSRLYLGSSQSVKYVECKRTGFVYLWYRITPFWFICTRMLLYPEMPIANFAANIMFFV
jgi:hypothetical protein